MGWGLGSLPLTLVSVTSSVLLLRFMTDSLGIAAVVASMIFASAKIWDAVSDPLMGWISDRIDTRWGRRLPWLVVGGIASGIALLAQFSPPDLGDRGLIAYMAGAMLLFATAYTMFMIPYMTMPAEMTDHYHERTQLMSFRVVFSSFGSLLGIGLAPILLSAWGTTREAHGRVVLLLAMIAILAVALCVYLVRDAPTRVVVRRSKPPALEQIRSAFANRPFICLMLTKLLYFFSLALTLTTFAYFTKHALKVPDSWLGVCLMAQTLALIASQPLWLYVARRLDKRNGFMIASALFAVAHLSWMAAAPGEPLALMVARCVVQGVAGGGTFLLTQAMLPDAIEYDYRRTGLRREGAFTGVYIMVEKVSGALGVAFVGLLLGALGYIESKDVAGLVQPESAVFGIYLCVAVLPATLQLLAIATIWPYDLTAERLRELREGRA